MFLRGHKERILLARQKFFLGRIGFWISEPMANCAPPNSPEPQTRSCVLSTGLLLRGHPLQKLREDIRRPPRTCWSAGSVWAQHDPMYTACWIGCSPTANTSSLFSKPSSSAKCLSSRGHNKIIESLSSSGHRAVWSCKGWSVSRCQLSVGLSPSDLRVSLATDN